MTTNNAFERSVGHRGSRLAAARPSWPAAQLGRYMSSMAASILAGVCVVLAAADLAHAATVEELEARVQSCKAKDHDSEYEMKAVRAFWGDASFMPKCLPPDPTKADVLTIYVEIFPNGRMGQLEIVPKTSVSSCISEHVRSREFPKPSENYVLKITLSFKQ